MDAADRQRQLARLLAATARAHHEATGGINDDWAAWYAEHMSGEIDALVGFSPPIEDVSSWLSEADERHGAEAPDDRWPAFYAQLILEEFIQR
jgi:hypothetical protein